MKFVDEVHITVRAGDGGRGCVSFRREKFRPRGRPDGGHGGDGGDVRLRVDPGLGTLLDLAYPRQLRAGRGGHGAGKDQHGKRGKDLVLRVPPGTLVYDEESGEVLADLSRPGQEAVVARGGRGGRGNASFVSPTNRSPRTAEPGRPGEERRLRLELKVLADVGLVGLPNAGKSTLLRALSAARPRVAPYPFTTLVPHLGVVSAGEERSFVMADIPGLIEGAHAGHGLGTRFLRHLARTAILLHLVDLSESGRDPLAAYDAVNSELELFDPGLAAKPQVVAATKLDLCESRERLPAARAAFAERGISLRAISAVSGAGLRELVKVLAAAVEAERQRRSAGAGGAERPREAEGGTLP